MMMEMKRTQRPVRVLTGELFEWMHTICKRNPKRKTLADVYLRDGFWYATDEYRVYRVPEAMISRSVWYVRHSEVFTTANDFYRDVNRLPCARRDISSKRYPDVGKVINQTFGSMGEITTRDLWIQCHDMFARGPHGSICTMPILDSEWQVQTAFIRDMLSLPHILGGTVKVFKVIEDSLFRFDFEYDISVYIHAYGV